MQKSASRERKSNSKEVCAQRMPNGTQMEQGLQFPTAVITIQLETFVNSWYCCLPQNFIHKFLGEGTRRARGEQSTEVLFAKCSILTNSQTFFLAKVSDKSIGEVFVAVTTPTNYLDCKFQREPCYFHREIPQMQKFPWSQYFVGLIFKKINFCGSGQPTIITVTNCLSVQIFMGATCP